MAVTSGSVSTSPLSHDSYYRVDWERTSYDSTTNKSTIKWTLYLVNKWEWYSNALRVDSIKIDGTTVLSNKYYSNYTTNGTFQLATGTTQITHDSDGSKTFALVIDAWFFSSTDVAGSDSFTLPTASRGIVNWGVNGQWKPCTVYWGVGGQWKQCEVYYGVNGQWKQVGGT